jgi:transcriptional regulator with XRE-family HTH domain
MVIHERLREERGRLRLHQKDVASLVGMTPRAQLMYEAGERHPDSRYLETLARHGFDVLYILTGRREPPPDLTAEETALVHKLRAAPAHIRATVHTVLGATAPASPSGTQIHADKIGTVSTGKIGKIVQNF